MAKKQLDLTVEVPSKVKLAVEGAKVSVSGPKGSISRTFSGSMSIKLKDNTVVISPASTWKKDRAVAGSVRSHIRNMINGVSSGVIYKLKIVYSHFPMSVKAQGNKVVIDNFIGEKHPRDAEIISGVSVEIKGQDVTVSGADKEAVSQTAANIEQATRIKKLDPRVFQDGIYIIEKNGKLMVA